MNKPFTVVYEDFKQELAVLINNSGLPASVIEPVLQNYLNETRIMSQRQYQHDKTQYENYLSQSQQDDEGVVHNKDHEADKE